MGVVHGIRSFVPSLVAQGGGHVVCTSSAAGISTTYAIGAYSATKHAVVGIAATLREELQAANVGVSVVCPGAVRTRIFESERNRPSGLSADVSSPADEIVSLYRRSVDASPDPSIVADAVYDAVVANRFFVLPSPEVRPAIVERIDAITDALDER